MWGGIKWRRGIKFRAHSYDDMVSLSLLNKQMRLLVMQYCLETRTASLKESRQMERDLRNELANFWKSQVGRQTESRQRDLRNELANFWKSQGALQLLEEPGRNELSNFWKSQVGALESSARPARVVVQPLDEVEPGGAPQILWDHGRHDCQHYSSGSHVLTL